MQLLLRYSGVTSTKQFHVKGEARRQRVEHKVSERSGGEALPSHSNTGRSQGDGRLGAGKRVVQQGQLPTVQCLSREGLCSPRCLLAACCWSGRKGILQKFTDRVVSLILPADQAKHQAYWEGHSLKQHHLDPKHLQDSCSREGREKGSKHLGWVAACPSLSTGRQIWDQVTRRLQGATHSRRSLALARDTCSLQPDPHLACLCLAPGN